MSLFSSPLKSAVCNTCPRECKGIRQLIRGDGFCGMGLAPKIAMADLHEWEEPCLSQTGKCGAVFFSGCVLRCVYCQNYTISHEGFGKSVRVEDLQTIYSQLKEKGAESLDLVSGTPFLPAIAQSLEKNPGLPVIWNSSGYEKVEALKLLENKVQIYLPDLKYIRPDLSLKLSGVKDYFQVTSKAIEEMIRQVGPCRFDDDGRLLSGVLVRHLVLPGYLENTFDVLDYYAESLMPKGAVLSLMGQFTPCREIPEEPTLNRKLSEDEYQRVLEYALTLGIGNGYYQELDSGEEQYIPSFDLRGVVSTL